MKLQLVDSNKLIKGEIYCVKRDVIIARNVMFVEYDIIGDIFAACKYPNNAIVYLFINVNSYYKYVSEEEYKKKLKEKYDATCLNIILKRLVDESFQW